MLLPDTHVIVWLLEKPDRLPLKILKMLEDSEQIIYLSAIVTWEIAIKSGTGKLKFKQPLANVEKICVHELGFRPLPITFAHTYAVQSLPQHHQDPFDRLLIAQASIEKLQIITRDEDIHQYPVKILWS